MRRIITFILLTSGLAAAGAPYTEPTYNQVERLIGAAGGTSVPSPVYTRPTYSQVERLIKTVKDGGGCDTNAVDILSNAAVVTNALTVATTNRVAVLEHSKADKSALGDKRDKTDLAVYEEQFSAWTHGELPRPTFVLETDQPTWYVPTEGEPDPTPYWKWRAHDEVDYSEFRLYASTNTEGGTFVWYVDRRPQEETLHAIRVKSIDQTSDTLATSNEVAEAISANEKTGTNEQVVRGELWHDYMWLIEVENADFARLALADEEGHNIIDTYATKSEVDDKADRATTLLGYGITNAAPLSMISEDDPTFSNAVLAVGLNIDTNSVAVLNDIASTFGGFPLGAGGTATTVGGLLAALAAAIAWLKKNKVQTLKLKDNSVETSADGGVAKLDDFFTESNSLLMGTIAAKSIPAFSSSSTYEVGEIVIYDGVAYKCVTAIAPAEEWTAAHWAPATNSDLAARLKGLKSDGKATDTFATDLLGKPVAKEAIDAEIIEKGTAPDAHLEAQTDEHLKLVLADDSVVYDSEKALPYKLTSAIGDRVVATMTLTAASTDITLPTIAANDTTVKDFILDVTNAYAVEGVATDAGINIPRTDFKLVTRDGESLTTVTTVKAGKSAFICFTQKSPVVVDGTTYPCWCVIQLPFGDPS